MTVRLVRTVDIAAIAYTAGFDSVYIDMEHSSFSLEAAGQICMACNSLGVTPLVRVPGLDPPFIARVMDAGAMGIIVPGVQSADEARAAVRAVKHAPLGERSLAGAAPQLLYRTLPADQTIRELDQASMVVPMIESRAGLDAADAIAAVEGVDMLLVGANDLSVELGVAGQMDHPQVHEAYLHVIDACRAHGKSVGIGGLGGRPGSHPSVPGPRRRLCLHRQRHLLPQRRRSAEASAVRLIDTDHEREEHEDLRVRRRRRRRAHRRTARRGREPMSR